MKTFRPYGAEKKVMASVLQTFRRYAAGFQTIIQESDWG
jgi:hypothetical protein